jgi:hypothetical protein
MPTTENNVYPKIDYESTSRKYYTFGKIMQMEIYKEIGKNPNIINNN